MKFIKLQKLFDYRNYKNNDRQVFDGEIFYYFKMMISKCFKEHQYHSLDDNNAIQGQFNDDVADCYD